MARSAADNIQAIALIAAPLEAASEDLSRLAAMLRKMGYPVELELDLVEIMKALKGVIDATRDLLKSLGDKDARGELFKALVAAIKGLAGQKFPALKDVAVFADGEFWKQLPVALMQHLVIEFVRVQAGALYGGLVLAGCIRARPADAARKPRSLAHEYIVPGEVWGEYLRDPGAEVRRYYNWNADAEPLQWSLLADNLVKFADSVGATAKRRPVSPVLAKLYASEPQRTQAEELVLLLVEGALAGTEPEVVAWRELGVRLAPIPRASAKDGDPFKGLYLGSVTYGKVEADRRLDPSWVLGVDAEFDGTVGVALRPSAAAQRFGAAQARFAVELRGEPATPWVLIGKPEGTHVTLGGLRLEFAASGGTENVALTVAAELLGKGDQPALRLAVKPDPDKFLGKVLGKLDMHAEADLALHWSSVKGLTVEGGVGLDVTIPINRRLGPIMFEKLRLKVRADIGERSLRVEAGLTVHGELGPLSMTIDEIGATAALTTASDGTGELGPFDLDFGFKPPTKLGFAVDAKVIKGGGFLGIEKLDDGSRKYTGAAAFSLFEGALGLAAFGIVITGPDRFSMLVSVTANFTPIQLGFGFTLNGVGGLLGINRTLDPVALGEGARKGQLDAVLFPKDAAKDAARILGNLDAFFPELHGSYVFGAMVSIGYQKFVEARLGVVITFPTPLRIALLGQLHAVLPKGKGAVRINLDVVGILDITGKRISVDAGLYDSVITKFSISGQMSMRLAYGRKPDFLLAIGGFHPAFVPPEGFPKLERLRLGADFGSYVKIGFQIYFSITSNTLQFGGAFDLFVGTEDFHLNGGAHFDALITFRPFSFRADIGMHVGITLFGLDLLAASVELMLSGPAPRWRVAGAASFTIAGIEKSRSFDRELGPTYEDDALEIVAVADQLVAALKVPSAWSTAGGCGVPVRPLTTDEIGGEAGPLWAACDGSIELRQSVAPLGLKLERFGVGEPDREGPYALGLKGMQGARVLEGAFAVGQFLDLSDEERLSAPSFEDLPCGVASGEGLGIPANEPAAAWSLDAGAFEVLAAKGVVVPAGLTGEVKEPSKRVGALIARRTQARFIATEAPTLLAERRFVTAKANQIETTESVGTTWTAARTRGRADGKRVLPAHLAKKVS